MSAAPEEKPEIDGFLVCPHCGHYVQATSEALQRHKIPCAQFQRDAQRQEEFRKQLECL
jgi:hypothetical protein